MTTKLKDVIYDNEPIGGGNPYWRCKSCKQSDPYVTIEGHRAGCEYVTLMLIRPELEELTKKIEACFRKHEVWVPFYFIIGEASTFEEGQQLLAVLEDVWELLDTTEPEDMMTALRLADEAVAVWAQKRS